MRPTLKRRLMDVEFNYNMQLRGMEQVSNRYERRKEGTSKS